MDFSQNGHCDMGGGTLFDAFKHVQSLRWHFIKGGHLLVISRLICGYSLDFWTKMKNKTISQCQIEMGFFDTEKLGVLGSNPQKVTFFLFLIIFYIEN